MPKFAINDRVQMPGVPFTVTVLEIGQDDEVGEVFKFLDPGGQGEDWMPTAEFEKVRADLN
ncbi:hypothetical protein [Micromonospora sp. NPDC050695]|uniref:hypothetical protein n=1 Tax=Micromonospora sp. NPDC050695 TaxID=3154938 RepID=UPI0033C37DF9